MKELEEKREMRIMVWQWGGRERKRGGGRFHVRKRMRVAFFK